METTFRDDNDRARPRAGGRRCWTGDQRAAGAPRSGGAREGPRRTFTAQYKRKPLAAYEAAPDGEKGAILRREGLYSSLITEWRRTRDAGALAGLKQPRGRPAADPRDAEIARLRKEKAKLEKELATSRFVVEVQSKLQALLETISESADTRPGRSRNRRGGRPARAQDRHQGGLPGGRRAAGHLVPAPPGQPAAAKGAPGPARKPVHDEGAGPRRAAGDPGRAAQRPVR